MQITNTSRNTISSSIIRSHRAEKNQEAMQNKKTITLIPCKTKSITSKGMMIEEMRSILIMVGLKNTKKKCIPQTTTRNLIINKQRSTQTSILVDPHSNISNLHKSLAHISSQPSSRQHLVNFILRSLIISRTLTTAIQIIARSFTHFNQAKNRKIRSPLTLSPFLRIQFLLIPLLSVKTLIHNSTLSGSPTHSDSFDHNDSNKSTHNYIKLI